MKKQQTVLDTLWAFVKIELLCWVIYILSSLLLVLIFYHDVPAGQRDFTPINWCLHIIYFIAYNNVFTKRINNEKINVHEKEFNIKEVVINFFRNDYMQIIFLIIFSIIFEVAMWLHTGPQNFFATIMVMFIPSAGAIDIPIVRTIVGFSISLLSMLISTVLIRYKKYNFWNKK